MPANTGASGRLLAVTDAQLHQISHYPVPPGTAEEINDVVAEAGIVSHLELAHFIAQCCYESGYFQHYTEGVSGDQYEGRHDLGNDTPGDGRRYIGRGAIQITGRYNYTRFNDWLQGQPGLHVDAPWDVVLNPMVVAQAPYRWLVAAWFWKSHRGLQAAAQQDDVTTVTKIINGGNGGLAMRMALTDRAIEVIG